jgi:hypothetical protein
VEASIGRDGFRSLSASIGPNFATEQMIGARQVNSEHDVDTIESNYLATIFLFDILIDNPDRVNPAVANAGKPNLMIHKDQCVVIDHEIAFAYTDLISFLQNPSPWVLRAEDHEVVTKHLLYLRQMKDQIDFEELVDNLIVFNDDFWDAVNLHLPSFHDGDTVSTIENHTRQLVDHRFELGKSINEMLYT